MVGPFFSLDGALLPLERAVVPADDIHFAYGFGVYETLKVRHGKLYFGELHEGRLFHSAEVIGLQHRLKPGDFVQYVHQLRAANATVDANIKALLIGGDSPDSSRLYIFQLNPLFPPRKSYKQGADAVTFVGERAYPSAKSLNMLVSTLAYRKAQAQGAYDALLVNRRGEITEGTRTNFFYTDGSVFYTPPAVDVLEGVTKHTVAQTLAHHGWPLRERAFHPSEIQHFTGFFLTSTSTKIMPLRSIDNLPTPIDPLIFQLMKAYDEFLDALI